MQTSNKKISLITAAALTVVLSQGVSASESTISAENTLNSSDLSFAFAQTEQPVQVLALSEKEMKETEGAWFNFVSAGWGAVGGGVSYASSTWASGSQWSWSGFGGSVVGGAVGGFFVNPALGATVGAGVGGAISGWASRF